MSEQKKKRQYNKKSSYWQDKSNSVPIVKASNTETPTSRLRLGEIGSTALSTIKLNAKWLKDYELRWPQCIYTYDKMGNDDDVSTALDANYRLVEKAFSDGEWSVVFNKDSEASREAAQFVEWCFKNMNGGQTLRSMVTSAITCKKYGFSVIEKCYTQVKEGEYAGFYKIDKLATRPQQTFATANPFIYTDDGREIKAIVQTIAGSSFSYIPINSNYTGNREIPISKVMVFGYNSTDANPFGESPLASVHKDWREKDLISNYEVVGVTKDLGGERLASL